eukprot:CAMPEP_0179434776 /NCGR_PEP_ID=MMETSP0799-20121207/19028_1 /TAXON_ID=46947 /ORGANISM="Geminigera cryophila, Strain CCMP2564" /LENGTH=121 /DNA_ID=CAMNT_0021213769 /DNA_START=815 /DNA_END=1181 /DNA_ORIENTATION=-
MALLQILEPHDFTDLLVQERVGHLVGFLDLSQHVVHSVDLLKDASGILRTTGAPHLISDVPLSGTPSSCGSPGPGLDRSFGRSTHTGVGCLVLDQYPKSLRVGSLLIGGMLNGTGVPSCQS